MRLAFALVLLAPIYAQDAKLTIAGDVTNPLTLTKADLASMPRVTVTIKGEGEDGVESAYGGVLLYDILKKAGAPMDKQLMGKALASYVVAEAHDGYQVVYSLPEIDPLFGNNKIVVADTVNGKPLFDYQGPFRIVIPSDKKGARSIRMLEKISVVRLRR